MKGLLYKEFLMALKYCRSFLLLAVVFAVVLLVEPGNMFYMAYPCLFIGALPVTLLSYDERDKWSQFSGILPVSRGTLVSAKYLIGLILQLGVTLLSGCSCFIGLYRAGLFAAGEYFTMLAMALSFSLLAPSIMLPFIFKLGVEKGRVAYCIVIGLCGAAAGVVAFSGLDLSRELALPGWGVGAILSASAVIYALSWLISIRFYEKREL